MSAATVNAGGRPSAVLMGQVMRAERRPPIPPDDPSEIAAAAAAAALDSARHRQELATLPTILPPPPEGRGLDRQRCIDARVHERQEAVHKVREDCTDLRDTHRTRAPRCGTHCHELQHREDDSRRRIAQLACGCWDCPRCRARLLIGHMAHGVDVLTLAVTDDGLPHPDSPDARERTPGVRLTNVYEWRGPATLWKAVRARIRRAGGRRAGYYMVRLDGGEIRVYADVAFRDADPVAPWLAAVRLADILRNLRPTGGRPITTGGRWRRAERPQVWKLGEYAGQSLEVARQILTEVGLHPRFGCDETGASGCEAWLDYRLPNHWTDLHAARLVWCIASGDTPLPDDVPPAVAPVLAVGELPGSEYIGL